MKDANRLARRKRHVTDATLLHELDLDRFRQSLAFRLRGWVVVVVVVGRGGGGVAWTRRYHRYVTTALLVVGVRMYVRRRHVMCERERRDVEGMDVSGGIIVFVVVRVVIVAVVVVVVVALHLLYLIYLIHRIVVPILEVGRVVVVRKKMIVHHPSEVRSL